MRVRWLKALAQFSPQYQLASHNEGVFQIIGPMKRSIEKSVADGIVAAIGSRERNGLPKPPRLKRGDAVRILKGPFAHHVGLYHGAKSHERIEVLSSLLGNSQRVTLPESDVEGAP
jgi:transcription antitermination factor NusG